MMFTFFISFTFPLAVYSLAGIQSTELLLILAEHQETIRQCTELMHIIQSGGVPDPIFLEVSFHENDGVPGSTRVRLWWALEFKDYRSFQGYV